MPGYLTKQERIGIDGVADVTIRSLLDRQQFSDPFGNADRRGISSATWPLFGLLWPSGTHLAMRMATHPVRPRRAHSRDRLRPRAGEHRRATGAAPTSRQAIAIRWQRCS